MNQHVSEGHRKSYVKQLHLKRASTHVSNSAFSTNTPIDELEVQVQHKGEKGSDSIKVPMGCNLKILKSILLFNLKPKYQSKQIIGFETIEEDYDFDYRLHQGIGQLKTNIKLRVLFQNEQYSKSQSIIDYKMCKILSTGGFSKVYLVRSLFDGGFYAAKFMLKRNDPKEDEYIRSEYFIHRELTHPYIVKVHQFIETLHFYVLIMEYCFGGEFFGLLKKQRHMPQQFAKVYFVQIMLALQHLHSKNILYRDIKPENILIDKDGHAKLADFGLSKSIKQRQKTFSYCGSLDYMAPQMIKNNGHSFGVDHYSMGNLLYQILIGCPPFYNPKNTQDATKNNILNCQIKFPDLQLSEGVKHLIRMLLKKDQQERLGFEGGIEQILSHIWFQDIDIENFESKLIPAPYPIKYEPNFQIDPNQYKEIYEFTKLIQEDIIIERAKGQKHQKKPIKPFKKLQNMKKVQPKSCHQSLSSKKRSQKSITNISMNPKSMEKLRTNQTLLNVLIKSNQRDHTSPYERSLEARRQSVDRPRSVSKLIKKTAFRNTSNEFLKLVETHNVPKAKSKKRLLISSSKHKKENYCDRNSQKYSEKFILFQPKLFKANEGVSKIKKKAKAMRKSDWSENQFKRQSC